MMLLEGISVYTVLMRDSTIMECVNTSYRSLNVGIHVCLGNSKLQGGHYSNMNQIDESRSPRVTFRRRIRRRRIVT